MNLLAVIAALALEQWRAFRWRNGVQHAFVGYAKFLEQRLNGGKAQQGAVAAALALVPPVTIVAAAYFALDQALTDRIKQHIRANTTPRHVPAKVVQVTDIPRTKSGKIVELAVRNVVHGEAVKNVEALANPEALEHFRDRPELAN